MQQALAYADLLDAPFAFSSNGDGFLLDDRTGLTQPAEREVSLEQFPSLRSLWPLYQQKGLTDSNALKLVEQPFHSDASGKEPRYYQRVAINRAIEAVAKGQQRVLLVMATHAMLVEIAAVLQYGTAAPGDLVTSPDLMADTLRDAPPGWQKKNLQMVLHVKVIAGAATSPTVVKTYFW